MFFHGSYLQANGIATFAAAIGAIAGLLTLWYYWRKRKPHIQKMVASDHTGLDVPYTKMYIRKLFHIVFHLLL